MGDVDYILTLAIIAAGAVFWTVFRQWRNWSTSDYAGWLSVTPSAIQYSQLAVALIVVLLCLFTFSVAGLPDHPQHYWGQIGLVCLLCGVASWTFAKLQALSRLQIRWRYPEIRFISRANDEKKYHFAQVESISKTFNWKVRFSDGGFLILDPNGAGSEQLVDAIVHYHTSSSE